VRIHDITAARIERTEGSVVIHVSEHGHVDGWDHRIEVPLEGITSFGYIDDLVRVVIVVDSLSHELRHELRFRNRYLARSVLDAIETGPDSDNLATNIAALIIGASLLVGAILAIIVIGIFIGASLGALGVVLYGAAIITGALKLLEHLIIKEDQ
jgi:hypothetical protein